MHRCTLRILICLILGAITTIAVAWGCAVWMPFHSSAMPSEEILEGDGYPVTTPGPDGSQGWWSYATAIGFDDATAVGARGAEGRFLYWRGEGCNIRRAGLPMSALRSDVNSVRDDDGRELKRWELPRSEILSRGLQTNDLPEWIHARAGRRIPLVPITLGFIVNTLTYAVAWAVAMFGPRWTMQFARRYHGHCPRCGYDLRDDFAGGCPECGWNRGRSEPRA